MQCHITFGKMSHQSEAMSHHFRIWCPKCHIKVKQCHITFEKMSHQSETLSHHFDIFGYFWHPKGVFGGFRGRFPLTRSILSYKMRIWREAKIQCFRMVDGFGRGGGKNIGLLEITITFASDLPELVL